MIKEAEYVNQIIQEAALLHLDRSSIDTWHPQPVKRKLYPFQADDDYISEGFKDQTINDEDDLIAASNSEFKFVSQAGFEPRSKLCHVSVERYYTGT